jgi:lysozyme family protein
MADTLFDKEYKHLLGVEGDYSNHKSDRGGATMYGVTEAVARAYGYKGEMKDLPILTARDIYKKQYWDILRLDEIGALSPVLAHELFDTGVNCGTGNAGKFLQRALNSMNLRGQLYSDIAVDGGVGQMTVFSLKAFLKHRGAKGISVMKKALDGQQTVYYMECAEKREANEDFVFGWIDNRVG